jgi:glycosyltransferase involved in cell wall biosynthesis
LRIVVVSSHYPPNFVSGGTLQPERLAEAMRARGHDVRVFAGWIGAERPALQRWRETASGGVEVDWVATTPWTRWSDRLNFDNPGVNRSFEEFLDPIDPDVVHFHSLQSFGAGLLQVAARRGATVALTMHDFWWFCARQFLVDRSLRPCSLVVECGDCACEVDRRWLEARNAFLARALDAADLILAPSASAARVLAANGIDSSRLEVDENGFPPGTAVPAPDRRAARDPRTLRLTYAGGPSELKGVQVLLQAARQLGGRPGWSLRAFGASGYGGAELAGLEELPVSLLPPFDPSELPAIMAGTDVLVVPSVMRETFSLVTREALSSGVPVVCTDTLGPEEVVTDGSNGLVVPAADPGALAAALRRLLEDPPLLERLQRGCTSTPLRSIEDQAGALLSRFERLCGRYRGSAAEARPERRSAGRGSRTRPAVSRVLFVCGIDGAPLRYRARLPAEAMSLLGVESEVRHYRAPEVAELAYRSDVVVLYRVPATNQILELLASLRSLDVPLVFDVDDVIFDPGIAEEIPALSILPPEEADLWMEGVRRYRTTMEECDLFVGATNALCRHASAVTGLPSQRFGNGAGIHLSRHADRALARERAPGGPRIAYFSGTKTHDRDWLQVEEAVIEVLRRHPEAQLWLVGHLVTSPALEAVSGQVRRIPFQRWDRLPYLLRDVDVNLAPLEAGSSFNEAKSAIKWLEAGLAGTPTVASPTEAYTEVIREGENGLLASSTDDWAIAISSLLEDPALGRLLGERARRDALLDWSPHLQGRRYLDILESAGRCERRRAAASWSPVANDEPPLPLELEPYVFDPAAAEGEGAAGLPPPARAAAEPDPPGPALLRRALGVWREEGAAALARRTARYLRRRLEASSAAGGPGG